MKFILAILILGAMAGCGGGFGKREAASAVGGEIHDNGSGDTDSGTDNGGGTDTDPDPVATPTPTPTSTPAPTRTPDPPAETLRYSCYQNFERGYSFEVRAYTRHTEYELYHGSKIDESGQLATTEKVEGGLTWDRYCYLGADEFGLCITDTFYGRSARIFNVVLGGERYTFDVKCPD